MCARSRDQLSAMEAYKGKCARKKKASQVVMLKLRKQYRKHQGTTLRLQSSSVLLHYLFLGFKVYINIKATS